MAAASAPARPGTGPVTRVDVSVTGEDDWHRAQLEPPRGPYEWQDLVTIGWRADTAGLDLEGAGVALDGRGYVRVDDYLRTTAPHVFAAGDMTGRLRLVPHAEHDGYTAATTAARPDRLRPRPAMAAEAPVEVLARVPLSFPTYANVLGRAAIDAAHQLEAPGLWDTAELAGPTP